MKFTTQFLTLLVASATLAEEFISTFSEECTNELAKYESCFVSGISVETGVYEKSCTQFESELCQKFFKTSIADIPACKGISKVSADEFDNYLKKIGYLSSKIQCAKDEQGKFCPFTPIENMKTYNYNKVTNETMPENEQKAVIEKSIKDACKSKKCVDEYLTIEELDKMTVPKQTCEFSKTLEEAMKKANSEDGYVVCYSPGFFEGILTEEKHVLTEYVDVQNVLTYLKSDTCTAQNIKSSGKTNGKADAESGATQVTYSSVLLVSLAALLATLL